MNECTLVTYSYCGAVDRAVCFATGGQSKAKRLDPNLCLPGLLFD